MRARVTEALLGAGFKFDPADPAYRKSGNESRYTIYRLPYEPVTTGEGALRPTIQIETAVWPLRRPAIELPVISFMSEALQRPPEIAGIACVSILETAADKFVGLTRRAGAELAGLDEPDPTLVRHLHDLHALREHYDPAEVAALAREVMRADAEAYGNQFPAYRENPMRETLRAVEGLAADPAYVRRYGEFERFMVYGPRVLVSRLRCNLAGINKRGGTMSAAGKEELETAPVPLTALERPIRAAAEDKLERGAFIERLCDAVIARGTKKATGITIGIIGPWGSGKSSILNLLHNYIEQHHPDAIVVRFDPWLISGRNDLISEFIAELIAELQRGPEGKTRFRAAIGKLIDYGNTLSPLATLVPYGTAVKDVLKMAKDHLDREKSLHEQRRELMEALAGVAAPIVVLIDELDRIEDEEIRMVAQLVRSVADFPGISYVLAYDAERVMRALGGSENSSAGGLISRRSYSCKSRCRC